MTTSDLAEVREHLSQVFAISDAVFLEPEHIEWKYFRPRPDWPHARSWALQDANGSIIAHMGLYPLLLELAHGDEQTWHGLDWTSTTKGSGRVLYEHISSTLCKLRGVSVGGNALTQAALPKIGYVKSGSVDVYAMPLRPWRQLLSSRPLFRPSRAQRLIRNLARTRKRSARARQGWTGEKVESFEQLRSLLTQRDPTVTRSSRNPEVIDYIMSCSDDCHGYVLHRDGQPVGYVVLLLLWGQMRVVELRVVSDDPGDWADAYATAIDLALDDPRTCEIVAEGSSDRLRAAIQANGLELVLRRPIWVDDPAKILDGCAPFELQASDSDHVFIGERQRPFMT